MDKSPDAFRTISEVSELLDTPAHVLRFWETRFSQVRPVKRAGGRRYYRPADVALLAGIKRLLHQDGLTIRDVLQILRDQGVRHVAMHAGEGFAVDALVDGSSDSDLASPLDGTGLPSGADMVVNATVSRTRKGAPVEARPIEATVLPGQALLPLFEAEPSRAGTAVLPSGPGSRPSLRDDASLAALVRAMPRGALTAHRAEIAALASRLSALRGDLVARSQGGQV